MHVPCASWLSRHTSQPLSIARHKVAPRCLGRGNDTVGDSLEEDWRYTFSRCTIPAFWRKGRLQLDMTYVSCKHDGRTDFRIVYELSHNEEDSTGWNQPKLEA